MYLPSRPVPRHAVFVVVALSCIDTAEPAADLSEDIKHHKHHHHKGHHVARGEYLRNDGPYAVDRLYPTDTTEAEEAETPSEDVKHHKHHHKGHKGHHVARGEQT